MQINLLMCWFVIFIITLIFAYIYANYTTYKASTGVRKLFHVSMSIVFLLGLKEDAKLLNFVSSGALILFIFLEVNKLIGFNYKLIYISFYSIHLKVIRLVKLAPLGVILESVFDKFRDEKDVGVLTLAHIYLLVGCSITMWIFPYGLAYTLSVSSGLITVAIGDTAAAVGGILFGRHFWKNSHKTYEGTFFAFVAQFLGAIFICKLFASNCLLSTYNICILLIISIIVALIEGNTTQVDNLVLPLYCYILYVCFIT